MSFFSAERLSDFFTKVVLPKDYPFDSTCNYEGYKSKFPRSTMILSSVKTGTPCAAFILHTEDFGCPVLLTKRPPPKSELKENEPDNTEESTVKREFFQGMFKWPDQVVRMTVINLSDTDHMVFSVFRKKNWQFEALTHRLNQGNVLRPNQVKTFEADATTGKQMILSGATHLEPSTGQSVVTTVENMEADEKKEGFYLSLNVVPEVGSSMETVFKEGTSWKATSTFVKNNVDRQKSDLRAVDNRAQSVFSFGATSNSDDYLSFSFGGEGNFRRSVGSAPGFSFGSGANVQVGIPDGFRFGASALGDGSFASFGANAPPPTFGGDQLGGAMFGGGSMARFGTNVPPPTFSGDQSGGARRPEGSMASFGAGSQLPTFGAADTDGSMFGGGDVLTSQAGKLVYGKSIAQEQVVQTLRKFNHECRSVPSVVGLSICPTLEFYPLPNLDEKVMLEGKNVDQKLIENLEKVWKTSDVCVIDGESVADTVICNCGHQCINHQTIPALLKFGSCPLCREPIVALVRTDDLA